MLKTSHREKGFTLIEVLVAIAIFASLSVVAYQVVNQIHRSNELSSERSERLKVLQRALVFLDNDFRQIAIRSQRINGEEPSKRLILWQDGLLDSDAFGVLFVRTGWQNPAQQFPRGETAKVGYRLREETLERVWWRYPDTTVAEEPVVYPLIDQVTAFTLRFYDGTEWLDKWEKEGQLPNALAVKLELQDYGVIERIYLASGGKMAGAEESTDGSP